MEQPSITPIQPNNQPASPNPVEQGSTEYQLRDKLLLLATLVATVTYAAGLNLPGGVWQDTQDGHTAGDLILHRTHYNRYLVFYYCNATAFAASLVVCLLLLVLKRTTKAWAAALRVVLVLDLLGLMGAYAAGSCRDKFTTIFSSLIMAAVLAYIVIAFCFYVFSIGYSKLLDCKQLHHKQGTGAEYKEKGPEDKEKGPVKQEENPEKQGEDSEHRREDPQVLMLLATFVVTITYVTGLNPPGGFWSDSQDGNRVSDPILPDHNSSRYQAFFVCNTTAFVSSIFIIMLLLDKKLILSLPTKKQNMASEKQNMQSEPQSFVRFVALYGFIVIALLGLVGAYAAGSCRELDTTAYVISLIVAVLAYIFLFELAILKKLPGITKLFAWVSRKAKGIEAWLKAQDNEKKENKASEALEKARNLVILLATLVASITYSAGLDPPGGLWQDDQDGHKVGDPILLTTDPTRYKVFFYSNSTAFVASLIVITMVQSRFLLKRHTLEAAMLLDLLGLIGAYAAGSCRDLSTTIYVVALAGAVLVYVVIHIVFFTLDNKDSQEDPTLLDNRREVLLLLAILVAALTYQGGLTPPGGFWSADDNLGHHAGFSVLLDNYPKRYRAFFYCNAISFMASVALIVLLVNPNLYRPGIRCYALYVCMVAGMFGLMGAYAAGSSRSVRTSIYVLTLVAAVFAFVILLVVVYFWIQNRDKKAAAQKEKEKATAKVHSSSSAVSSDPASGHSGQGVESGESSEIRADNIGNESAGEPKGKPEKELQDEEKIRKEKKLQDAEEKKAKEAKDEEERKAKELKDEEEKKQQGLREYLMLLGILAASVTYQTGLKPPGGLWGDNDNGHTAGNSILHDTNRSRYHAFFYSNSTSFMASIVVVVLLLPKTLHKHELHLWPMHTAVLLNMLSLLVAYAAGSTREFGSSMNVIYLVIPVLLYIAAYAVYEAWSFRGRKKKKKQDQIGVAPPTNQG